MVSSVTKPSASAVRVVIGGMTIRLGIWTEPMRAGVKRMFSGRSRHRDFAAVEIDGRPVQPGCARGDDEGHQIGHVFHRAVAHQSDRAAKPLADLVLRLAGALDLGADALP